MTLQFVPSQQQLANILTKGLDSPQFKYLCSNLMLGSSKHKVKGDVRTMIESRQRSKPKSQLNAVVMSLPASA